MARSAGIPRNQVGYVPGCGCASLGLTLALITAGFTYTLPQIIAGRTPDSIASEHINYALTGIHNLTHSNNSEPTPIPVEGSPFNVIPLNNPSTENFAAILNAASEIGREAPFLRPLTNILVIPEIALQGYTGAYVDDHIINTNTIPPYYGIENIGVVVADNDNPIRAAQDLWSVQIQAVAPNMFNPDEISRLAELIVSQDQTGELNLNDYRLLEQLETAFIDQGVNVQNNTQEALLEFYTDNDLELPEGFQPLNAQTTTTSIEEFFMNVRNRQSPDNRLEQTSQTASDTAYTNPVELLLAGINITQDPENPDAPYLADPAYFVRNVLSQNIDSRVGIGTIHQIINAIRADFIENHPNGKNEFFNNSYYRWVRDVSEAIAQVPLNGDPINYPDTSPGASYTWYLDTIWDLISSGSIECTYFKNRPLEGKACKNENLPPNISAFVHPSTENTLLSALLTSVEIEEETKKSILEVLYFPYRAGNDNYQKLQDVLNNESFQEVLANQTEAMQIAANDMRDFLLSFGITTPTITTESSSGITQLRGLREIVLVMNNTINPEGLYSPNLWNEYIENLASRMNDFTSTSQGQTALELIFRSFIESRRRYMSYNHNGIADTHPCYELREILEVTLGGSPDISKRLEAIGILDKLEAEYSPTEHEQDNSSSPKTSEGAARRMVRAGLDRDLSKAPTTLEQQQAWTSAQVAHIFREIQAADPALWPEPSEVQSRIHHRINHAFRAYLLHQYDTHDFDKALSLADIQNPVIEFDANGNVIEGDIMQHAISQEIGNFVNSEEGQKFVRSLVSGSRRQDLLTLAQIFHLYFSSENITDPVTQQEMIISYLLGLNENPTKEDIRRIRRITKLVNKILFGPEGQPDNIGDLPASHSRRPRQGEDPLKPPTTAQGQLIQAA